MPLPLIAAAAAKPLLSFLGKNALPIAGGLLKGGANLFANNRLRKAQEDAIEEQGRVQSQYKTDFDTYQAGMNSLIRKAPQRKIDDSLINQVVGQAQGDLLASQGRAAGTEAKLDAVRQNTADQAYRASQVARTPMDLLGAIGQISAGESSLVNRIQGDASRDRVARIDKKQENLQRAIEKKSVFRNNADNLLFNDKLNNYNRSLNFNQQANLQRLNTNLSFDQFNIKQKAALESQRAAGIQGFGSAIGDMTNSLIGIQNNKEQMANDLAIAGLESK
jgi:hypothetical protein